MEVNIFRKILKSGSEETINYLSGINSNSEILWYPSAGNDFRDVFYFKRTSTEEIMGLNISEPEYYIHTDYNKSILDSESDILFEDDITKVTILEKQPFQLLDLHYFVDKDYISADPSTLYRNANGLILHLRFETDNMEPFTRKVIYLFYENINFFTTFVLLFNLNISHFYKLREGCGFGGGRQSISFVYNFLGLMKTKYLLVDHEVHYDDFEFLKSTNLISDKLEYLREFGPPIRRHYSGNLQDSLCTLYDIFLEDSNFSVDINELHTIHRQNDFTLRFYEVVTCVDQSNKEERALANLRMIRTQP
jgi:hypothetical protein